MSDGKSSTDSNTGMDWLAYAAQVSAAQGMQLDEGQLQRAAAQLEMIAGIAAPLLALQLPAEVEPAPVYRP